MSTIHINAKENEISKNVLMPGDPNRCKFIADNYLKDVKIVNTVRNMTAYTGYYNDKLITVFPSGMGIPSMGIYSYELFNFYNVEKIIRIGTSGAGNEDIKVKDLVLATSAYSLSTFAELFDGTENHLMNSNEELNKIIELNAKELNINLKKGLVLTSDIFDVYLSSKDKDNYYSKYPKDLKFLACEMETFCLLYMANKFNKKATSLVTVVDSPYEELALTSEEREKSLREMIELALKSI